MKMACAWAGCTEAYEIIGRCPEGWHSMLVFDNRESPIVFGPRGPALVLGDLNMKRDSMLCAAHAAKLESLLKDIGGRLDKTKGNA